DVTNSVISGNTALSNGGGVYASPSVKALTVSGCTFSGNRAIDPSTGRGGGIQSKAAQITISRSTFTGNSAGVSSGGVGCKGAITISRSRFPDHSAPRPAR